MTNLHFDEKTHTYTVDGVQLESVTKWVSSFFPEFDLKGRSKRVAKFRREKGELNAKGKPITARDVQKEWKETTKRGTAIHLELETFFKGDDPEIDLSPEAVAGILKATEHMDHFFSTNIMNINPEFRVWSSRFGLAGTIDFPIFFDTEDGKSFRILDWKCVKNLTPDKIKKYELQLSTYAYILEYETLMKCEELYLIQLKDGKAIEHKVTYQKDKIIEMLKESGRW